MSEPAAPPSPPAAPAATSPSWLEHLRDTPMTFALLLATAVVFLIAERHGPTTETPTLLRFGACERLHVRAGEWWRLGSYMFLHVGWMHLLWNGYGGFSLNRTVERALGPARFLLVYLVSGLVGGCFSVLFHDVVTAGASGALFGAIGAVLALLRRRATDWRAFWTLSKSILINIAVWTALGLTVLPMDNFAHMGGLAGGIAVTWLMTSPRRSPARWAAAAAALVLLVLVTARPGWRPSAGEAPALRAWARGYVSSPDAPAGTRARMLRAACAAGNADVCSLIDAAK